MLFALAVIARDSSRHYVSHLLALAAAGVLPALERAMAAYRSAVEEQVGAGARAVSPRAACRVTCWGGRT